MKTALVLLLLTLTPVTALAQNDAGSAIENVAPATLTALVLPPSAPVGAPNPDTDMVQVLKAVHAAVVGKEWGKLTFIIVTLLVWLTRKFLVPRVPVLGSSLSLMIQTFLWTFSGMLATTWGAGQTPTSADIFAGLQIAFAAAGGWAIFKNLLELLAGKYAWAKSLYELVMPKPPAAPAPAPVA